MTLSTSNRLTREQLPLHWAIRELKQQRWWRLRNVNSWIHAASSFIALIPSRLIRQMLANFLELNSKGLYDCSRKEKESCCLVFPSSTKREIRHFHVVVVQRRLRNVQKRLMHVWSCCFANINLLLFCRSRCPRCHRCLSSLLFYFHARRILWTGSTNWTSKIPHQKAFIYVIDVSDTVKAIGVKMDSNSLTLTEHSPYILTIFFTVTVSVIVPFRHKY